MYIFTIVWQLIVDLICQKLIYISKPYQHEKIRNFKT
jgi:hypothetical protein